MVNKCILGAENRQRIIAIESKVISLHTRLDTIEIKMVEMFNHMSNRLPTWATTVIALLTAMLGGAMAIILK